MGKRLTEIIEHYCRGSVWLKSLICTTNYVGGTEGTPQVDKEEEDKSLAHGTLTAQIYL